MSEIHATIAPTQIRRTLGTAVLGALGLVLIYVCMTEPPAQLQWIGLLLLLGAGSIYTAFRMWSATEHCIELTDEEVRFSNGQVIAKIEDIASVDRGLFSFKPSNGFLIRLKRSAPAAWAPGVWWRIGKRAGIGGVTPAGQAKTMADILAIMIAERDGLVD